MNSLAFRGIGACACGVRSIVGTGSVVGVGDWSGFFSGVGQFLGSDLGKAILTVGTTVGGAYISKELLGNGNQSQGQQGAMTGSGYVNPAGSGFIPQAGQPIQAGIVQSQQIPAWALPVALGVGGLLLLLAMRR